MKRYSNIPIKERIRNADRVYRHEQKLEEINFKRLVKEKFEEKENNVETDKDRYFDEIYAQIKSRLGIESEDTK